MTLFGDEHVRRYRETGGEVGHDWEGTQALILSTTGRKSGEQRDNALIYGRNGDDLLVVASKGGADAPPAWYLNLQAQPEAEVQVRDEVYKVRARDATDEEKPALWAEMVTHWPAYDEYQTKTERPIPVVVLERAEVPRLEGKVALVTGGGGSIGGATARAFAAEGAKVVVADIDADGVERVVSDLGADVAAGAVGDVTDSAAVAGAVQLAVERFGGLHVAFANAGVFGSHASVAEYPEDVFDRVMAVNVKGSFLVCKHAMAAMGDGPGSIVINSSVVGLTSAPGILGYATAKHALVGLMRTAAQEGAPKGIRVNSIHPGPVDNRFQHTIEVGATGATEDEATRIFDGMIPLDRHARPDEIASAVLFLASDESSFVTGATIAADGGLSI
jgi:deazaflavin-dependent oxidoreductase (nitroreductase family)